MMIKNLLHPVFAAILLCSSLISCSGDSEKEEKSAIEQATEKAGHQAAEKIKTPLDQADMAAEQQNSHAEQIKEIEKSQ